MRYSWILFVFLACRSGSGDDPGQVPIDSDTDSDTTDLTDSGSDVSDPDPVQHASCTSPFPDNPPSPPTVRTDGGGVPTFDKWTQISCNDVTSDVCDAVTPCPNYQMCLQGVPDGRGVCISYDSDTSCDGDGEVLNFMDGSCWICAPAMARATACCQFPDGFDCQPWPYEEDRALGMPCSLHANCEPGLVCGDHRGAGYGICQCPEAVNGQLTPPNSCFN